MPYINEFDREDLDNGDMPLNAGELNYVITSIIDDYICDQGKSYNAMNEVIGALECAKLEMYRRVCAPYEDEKNEQNGEVYDVIKIA